MYIVRCVFTLHLIKLLMLCQPITAYNRYIHTRYGLEDVMFS